MIVSAHCDIEYFDGNDENHFQSCLLTFRGLIERTVVNKNGGAIFVYNAAFDIAGLVRNLSGCTLLRELKLVCN